MRSGHGYGDKDSSKETGLASYLSLECVCSEDSVAGAAPQTSQYGKSSLCAGALMSAGRNLRPSNSLFSDASPSRKTATIVLFGTGMATIPVW